VAVADQLLHDDAADVAAPPTTRTFMRSGW